MFSEIEGSHMQNKILTKQGYEHAGIWYQNYSEIELKGQISAYNFKEMWLDTGQKLKYQKVK